MLKTLQMKIDMAIEEGISLIFEEDIETALMQLKNAESIIPVLNELFTECLGEEEASKLKDIYELVMNYNMSACYQR